MYRCEACGHLFEEGEEYRWTETHGFNDGLGEQFSGCPVCKETGYYEVKPCKNCASYNHHEDEKFCDECKKEIVKRFSEFVNNNFTADEREYLNEAYDGEWI